MNRFRLNPALYEVLGMLSRIDREEDAAALRDIVARFLDARRQDGGDGTADGSGRMAGAGEDGMFLAIDAKVTEGRLFCDPDFNRDRLVRVSGIEKNRLAAVVRRFTGTNIPGYINARRMEYAVGLMRQHPDYTLVAIAGQCGFRSQTTFIRVFRHTFGMTPSEYMRTKILPPPSPFMDEMEG